VEEEEVTGSATDDAATVDNSVLEAAIAERDIIIAQRDATIADLNANVQATKAANYDLLMSLPNSGDTEVQESNDFDDDTPDVDDLFESKDR
jgi:hypothetical protein